MTITPARSPLGAFYRSPLGVMGDGFPILLYWYYSRDINKHVGMARISTGGTPGPILSIKPRIKSILNPNALWSGVSHVSLVSGGKLLVAGEFTEICGQDSIKYMARVALDGTLDDSFNITELIEGQLGSDNLITSFTEDSDGYVFNLRGVYGTDFNNIPFIRVNLSGVIDETFGDYGSGTYLSETNNGNSTYIKYINGSFFCWIRGWIAASDASWDTADDWNTKSRTYLCKLTSSGLIDASFSGATRETYTGAPSFTEPGAYFNMPTGDEFKGGRLCKDSCLPLDDGSVLFAFDSYYLAWRGMTAPEGWNSGNRPIIKLSANGYLDQNWLCPESSAGMSMEWCETSIAMQPDGKILVAGNFRSDGVYIAPRVGIFRLNADGSLDETFNAEITSDNGFASMCVRPTILPNGNILIGFYCNKHIRFSGTAINYARYVLVNKFGKFIRKFDAMDDSIRYYVDQDLWSIWIG